MPEAVSIQVGGNVDGSIVVGDHNFVVNTNHGTIIYKRSGPQVRPRQFAPQPPRPPREFVDRTEELAKLEAWIAAHEIVLIHAPDGMGKSSLLKQAANSAAAKAMPAGVVLLESVDVDGQALGPDDLVQKLFDALFESDPPLKVDAVSARTYLSNTRPLVLMDEVGLSPAFQKALPDLFPQGAILLTADLPLGGDFERLPIGPLPRREAVNLLAARADLTLNDANRVPLDAACELLHDVSLAIVIGGNVMRETHTSPAAALQELQAISSSSPDPVTAALDRAFAFAFGRLSADEQQVLSAAALTPGVSMTVEWLAAALPGIDVEAYLARLQALGLLFANSPRLRLPAGFRAQARQAATLDEQTILGRLVGYLTGPLQQNPQNWEHIRDELGNFTGALSWALRLRRWGDVLALGQALDAYLCLHGLWDAWGTALGYILDAARAGGEQPLLAWALHESGVRAFGGGSRQQALEFLRQALELRRVLGDTVGMAYTQHNIDVLLAAPAPGGRGSKPSGGQGSRPNWFLRAVIALGVVAAAVLAGALGVKVLLGSPETPVPAVVSPSPTVTPVDTLTPTPTLPPTPVADSNSIVFTVQTLTGLEATGAPSLYTIHPDGSGLARLLDMPARDPAWSPDGKRLAFASNSKSDFIQIYLADADGSNAQVLQTDTPLNETHPSWSPDGKRIAFTGTGSDQNSDIYEIGVDGSGLVNLSGNINDNVDYAEWSPDGSKIAFQDMSNGSWEIFMMNADGSDPVQLTFDTVDQKGGGSLEPSWSPDGTRLAFASNRTGVWNIYVMNPDGSDVVALTQDKDNDLFPDWSPDGQWLAFSSNRDGALQIYLMAADGSGISLLKDVPGIATEPDWQPAMP